nr:protein NYNRIN-like [Tanacetum cinerariifolium]
MSRDVLTVGSIMRIPLLYREEYSQWVERFMNYLEEQTDGKGMINSIKNGDQPLPRVTQVSIAGTTLTEQPPLKDKSIIDTACDHVECERISLTGFTAASAILKPKRLKVDKHETFDNLQKINMKLNLKKCSFGVEEGKLLSYVVTSKGIRANLKKTKVVADMQSLKTLKEMQNLSGKLAAFNRFLARSAKRSLPFFETLKNIMIDNKDDYRWMVDA